MNDDEKLKVFAKELHTAVYKPKKYRRVVVSGKLDKYGIDLIDMGRKFLDVNDGYRYIVNVEDIFTRRMWLRASKTKDAPALWALFEDVLKDGVPKKLWSDMEGGIFSEYFDKKLGEKGIEKFTTHSAFGVANVESSNRSLRKWMGEMWTLNQNRKWVGLLGILQDKWNNHKVRTIGMTPMEAWNHANPSEVWKKQYGDAIPVGEMPDLKVGDKVRITKYKNMFAKSHEMNWTPEVFTIDRINSLSPPLYYLKEFDGEPVIGAFYREELLKTAVPDVYLVEEILARKKAQGVKMVKVRWLGWPDKYDTWEPESNVYKSFN